MIDASTRHPFAVRVPREVVRARGAEVVTYLQGQLSQDVAALAPGESAWTFVLQPQGKVDAWFRVTRTGPDELVLDVDAGWRDQLIARLERFKLRVDAAFEPLDWACVAVRHVDPSELAGSAEIVAPVTWGGLIGADLLGAEVAIPDGIEEAPAEAYAAWRVAVGFPAMGSEIDQGTIPAETGVVDRSASFAKGCYTGQELVARIDSRGGNTPRRLCRLTLDASGVEPGDQLVHQGGNVGSVTTVAGGAALGYVRRKVEVPATVEVHDPDGVPRGAARVEALGG